MSKLNFKTFLQVWHRFGAMGTWTHIWKNVSCL